jgi:PAS domain S-box-containing protein
MTHEWHGEAGQGELPSAGLCVYDPHNHRANGSIPNVPQHSQTANALTTEEQLWLAKKALWVSEARKAAILETVLDGIITIDHEGKIVEFNPAAEHLLGYSQAEAVGQPMADLIIPPALREQHAKGIARYLADGVGPILNKRIQMMALRADGTEVPVELAVTAIHTAGPPLFTGYLRDLTAHKQAEETLGRTEQQLRQAQKMEAVGQLAGGVAHDFNNLLTIILGYGELLLSTLSPTDPSCELVQEMKKAGERAASLTRQLLAFSRQQVLAPKNLYLDEQVREAEKMLRRIIGEDIDLAVMAEAKAGPVRTDPGQLDQVLLNLAVNARDAMPRGGKLTIEVKCVDLDPMYAQIRPGVKPGPHVLLAVSDTGHGMTPEVKARIFEPFFTTKEPGKGTGLGLATVYGIIKQSGGHLDVYSEPGKGTCFKIYLPRSPGGPLLLSKSSQGNSRRSCGNETLLLVEDEDTLRVLARHILQSCGYTVLEAQNGTEALRVFTNHPETIQLVVSDVIMPQMGGRELADRLTVLRPGVKILFCSGYTDDTVVRHGILEAGAEFLQKPFTPTRFARKVREVLDQ